MAIKTKWTAAVLVVLITFLSSCETKNFYEEYYNVNSYTKDFTVLKNQWNKSSDDSGDYLFRKFTEPKLTDEVFDYGIMQAFLVLDNGNTLSPLPFDDYWYINSGYDRTEQVTCEFSPGYVTFILKYSDHLVNEDAPYYDYTFRVRFLW
jgi:hypothetical protein